MAFATSSGHKIDFSVAVVYKWDCTRNSQNAFNRSGVIIGLKIINNYIIFQYFIVV